MSRIASILAKNVLALLFIELAVRGTVLVGLVSLPPAGLAGFDAVQGVDAGNSASKRLFRPDRDLIQRMKPDFKLVYNRRFAFAGEIQTYTVDTNKHGFRTPSFSRTKPPATFRIVCLGDSSTFGLNVEEDAAYPQALGRMLDQRFPGRFEVLNLGTPGYTTRQGLELLRQVVLDLDPDLVTFAYGTNDRFFGGPLSDDRIIRFNQSPVGRATFVLREGLEHSDAYRLLKRAVSPLVERPSDTPKGEQQRKRVSLDEMRDSIVYAARDLAERGVPFVILNNDFAVAGAKLGLQNGAEASGAPLLDMQRKLLTVRRERTRRLEKEHHLPPGERRQGMILLRVIAPGVRNVQVAIQRPGGTHFTAMRDDGREGDQGAADGIWSAYVPGRAGKTHFRYAYHGERGESGKEFCDTTLLPGWRVQQAPPSGIGELDTFGQMYLFSDGAHPDEEGHQRIADTLFRRLLTLEPVRAALQRNRS